MNYVDPYIQMVSKEPLGICDKRKSRTTLAVDEDGVFCWFDGWRPTRDRVEPTHERPSKRKVRNL